MMILASASGNTAPAIARLVAAHEDTVREVIHGFNEIGLAVLEPHWAGGRPSRFTARDEEFIVTVATTRPRKPGRPFTHRSIREPAGYLGDNPDRVVTIGRERPRCIPHAHHISFQRTRTWKESADPDKDAKPVRIEEVTGRFPDRCLRLRPVRPASIRPCHGTCWAAHKHPGRLPATYHRTHGIGYFHGRYSVGDDQLWGVTRPRKGADHSLAALKSIRSARPDGAPLYVILDHLPANKTATIRTWARKHKVELCFTPTSASWANPISVNRPSGGGHARVT